MSKFDDTLEQFVAPHRQVWRDWLSQNHQQSHGVWLVYYKVNTNKPSIKYSEAVKEALCFGWIDSKVKSLDRERYQQIFTPRKPKSVWSKLNKQYITELIEQNLITKAGFQAIEIAKQNGSWNFLDSVEELVIPDYLQQAFFLNKNAAQSYEQLNKSQKKNILLSIVSAKRKQTRASRIEKIINNLQEPK